MSRVLWFKFCLISATLTVAGIAVIGHIVASAQTDERERLFVGHTEPVPGVSNSDDYVWHSRQFQRAARDLISRGECGEQDFTGQSGFARAGAGERTYVIRCAGDTDHRDISLTVAESGDYQFN
jgi:hypothetical protein